MPLEIASILISALAQIAGEYGAAMPLAGIARRILDDKARQNAFAEAVAAAYADLRKSEHGDVAQALLDPHYLSRPAVAHELLSGVLVAGQVDYERLQHVYARSTGLDVDVEPALRYLVDRIRQHTADRHPWFQALFELRIELAQLGVQQQQLQTGQQMAQILERIDQRFEALLKERGEVPAPQPAPEPEPQPALRVLVLLSAPLVDSSGGPIPRLDVAQERILIETALRESGADIQARFRPATAEALRDGVRDGYDVVHFSGHGEWSRLAFEDEHGGVHYVDQNLLPRLVRVGGKAVSLVVLNACYSESMVRDLIAAAVAHVVAVDLTAPVTDRAGIAFARDFYHALARGNSLAAAFDEGKDAVASTAALGADATLEERKFFLLPEDADHDVRLADPDAGHGGYSEDRPLAAPTNLPAPLETFVGREREMWEINQRLSEGRLVTLTGTGGIGKTELARETARWHHHRGRFPDGVFVVELEGAQNPAAVLTQIATAVGLERAESAQDVAGALRGQRMLLVLDNLDDALHADLAGARDLLEALVTGTEAPRFLVTSRQPVGRPRWENVYPVERLRPPADRELFTGLAENAGYAWHAGDDSVLADVLGFLDGLPLAIVLAAAQLSEVTLAQLWDDLQRARTAALNEPGLSLEERNRLTSVDFSLTLSYSRLPEDAQRLFAAFSVFAGGADEDALDAVWGDDGWREPMRVLRRFSLVTERRGRYSMLNPVREFAAARLAEGPDAPYHARMAHHYQQIAATCDAGIGGEDTVAALNLMALELPNIRAGMDWAVQAVETGQTVDGEPAWTLVRDYAKVLYDFAFLRGLWEEGEQRLRLGLDACREAGDEAGVAFLAHNLGIIVQYRGDYGEARRLYEEGLAIREKLGNQAGIARSLHQMGRIAQDQGEYTEARRLYDESLAIKQKLGDQAGIALTVWGLGNIALDQGDIAEAQRQYEDALSAFQELGDKKNEAGVLHQLGRIAQEQGEYGEARRLYGESLAIKEKLGDQAGIARSLHQMGRIAQDQGEYTEARRLFEESLAIAEKLGDQAGIARSLHQLGMIAQDQGDYGEARRLYEESLAILEKLGNQAGIARSLHQLGAIAELQGDYSEARRLYEESLAIKEKLGDQAGIASSTAQLGVLALAEGNRAEARRLFQQALQIFERLKSPYAELARRYLEDLDEEAKS